jgi:hypothetical protein
MCTGGLNTWRKFSAHPWYSSYLSAILYNVKTIGTMPGGSTCTERLIHNGISDDIQMRIIAQEQARNELELLKTQLLRGSFFRSSVSTHTNCGTAHPASSAIGTGPIFLETMWPIRRSVSSGAKLKSNLSDIFTSYIGKRHASLNTGTTSNVAATRKYVMKTNISNARLRLRISVWQRLVQCFLFVLKFTLKKRCVCVWSDYISQRTDHGQNHMKTTINRPA